jgi:ABC-type lipoprotein export system ATPase subunit
MTPPLTGLVTAAESAGPIGLAVAASDLFCLYSVPTGTVAALRGLSLAVAEGERLVVHGPNGSGKTTLLRVLMGEQPASAGSVQVAGVDLAGADEVTRSRLRLMELGVVDQHSARALRPELTVRDNVGLQLRLGGVDRAAARCRADEVLAALGLAHLADRTPDSLAGGEAQRVAVCAAVAHRPSVVLADEPSGELDAAGADEVYDLLASAVTDAGATLLLVTHDPRAARIADRVVRIRDGRLSEQWSPDAPHEETLVVDDRGWVRLPERLRHHIGASGGVRAAARDRQIVLQAAEPAGLASAARRATEDRAPTPRPGTRPSRGPLLATLEQVRISYGDRLVVDGFDLELTAGTLAVLRGRSGSGKSSLLRVMLGLADPQAGRARLGGQDLGQLDRAARAELRRELVAVAAQGGSLAEPLDVVENLTLARTLRGLPAGGSGEVEVERIVAALGLHPVRGRAVRLLSGGERQRVAVARCLAANRPLIVLDEPTSQQDEAHAELIAGVLADTAIVGGAILAATHDPVLVDAADVVINLD